MTGICSLRVQLDFGSVASSSFWMCERVSAATYTVPVGDTDSAPASAWASAIASVDLVVVARTMETGSLTRRYAAWIAHFLKGWRQMSPPRQPRFSDQRQQVAALCWQDGFYVGSDAFKCEPSTGLVARAARRECNVSRADLEIQEIEWAMTSWEVGWHHGGRHLSSRRYQILPSPCCTL